MKKTGKRMDERGFLFLEAAVLGLLLMTMAALFALPRQAAELHRMEACRTAALFLAEQELAEMEWRVERGALAEGSCGWFGPERDLAGRQTSYEIAGSARREGKGFSLTARVSWQEGGKRKELQLERWAVKHDVP